MKAIGWLTLCAALWTGTGPSAVATGPASAIPLVARLNPGSAADPAQKANLQAFRDGMRALGHIEGRTYRLEARFAEGDAGRLPALARELVRLKPEIILAAGYLAVRSVKNATNSVPIVMATFSGDPVRAGFAESLARPGGNVTGLAGLLAELTAKQLDLLRELVPRLSTVAIMYNSALIPLQELRRVNAAAAALGLTVRLAGVARPEDLETAFETIRAAGCGGLLILPDPALMARKRARIAGLALRHRLPSVFTFRTFTEAGGLLSYAHDLRAMHRRSADFVDRILKGAKPADLPVERPSEFELVVNLKTAKALGVTIPPSILLRANEVIE